MSGGISRFVPVVLATLLVAAVTALGILAWHSGAVDTAVPPGGVALAASSYTMLLLGWLAMVFNHRLAPADFDGTREAGDVRQLTVVGLWLALMTLLTAIVAFSVSREHPPLRRIAVILGAGAVVLAVLWLVWNGIQPTYEA
jgi:hypothetical protein